MRAQHFYEMVRGHIILPTVILSLFCFPGFSLMLHVPSTITLIFAR